MEEIWTQLLSEEIVAETTFETSYSRALDKLKNDKYRGVVICIKNIPFDRDPSIHISAVLPLQDRGFYLKSTGVIKNLFLLGESHTIHYTHEFIPFYVRDFNDKVNLQQINESELGTHDFEVSTIKSDNSIELNQKEFIPECGEGIYVVLSRKEDIDFRQKLIPFHHPETMEISNLQRQLLKKCEDKNVKGIFIERDKNGHLHGALAFGDKVLQYVTYSQSTTHEFCENFMEYM